VLKSSGLKHPKATAQQTREFLAGMAFNQLLGFELAGVHRDGLTLQCRIRKELLNSVGVLHGGVAASLADTAVGSALFRHFGGKRLSTTVEFKINYFRPVVKGRLLARARFLRMGSTLCISQVDLADEQRHEVGVAIVTYMFLDARSPERSQVNVV
jgi:uncharacterized protein (TIGR00369 family)